MKKQKGIVSCNMKKVLLLIIFLFALTINSFAQVTFEIGAPNAVEVGSAFKVEFKSNAKPQDFLPPDFKGFNVIAGPTISTGQSVNIINGSVTREESYTYVFVLQATETGNVTIGPAEITVKGEKYSTKSRIIEVVSGGGSAEPSQNSSVASQNQSATLASDDILLIANVSSRNVYKGQPVRVTFKLLTRASLRGIDNVKMPAFNNFWTQEIDVNDNGKQETYNNKVYEAVVLKEYLLYPQQAGELVVEPMSITALAQIVTQNRRQSIFDDFFGGGPSVQQIRKDLATQPVRINVKELPAGAPVGFNGAVGNFALSGGIAETEIAANQSGNYIITISGTGNLPTVNAPKVTMPSSFEQYSVRTNEDYRTQGNNISGSKTFTIPFIARAEGRFTIDAVNFTFFNTTTEQYETVTIPAVSMNITGTGQEGQSTPGIISGTKEDLRILDNDIRYIRTGSPDLRTRRSFFIWSLPYFLTLFLLLCGFICSLIYLREKIEFNSNTKLVRNKKAQKIALKRLKNAEKNMLAKNEQGFYEEMLKAMWGYMSDKLDIPVAELSKDNIKNELSGRGIDEVLIDRYIKIISDSEFARYAPVSDITIGDIYNSAVDTISKLEAKI
ncbi:MAG: BatD family protein [Rikenellaceae bacterium]|nr:BatD family protein [Rikenellaceae bacterium]